MKYSKFLAWLFLNISYTLFAAQAPVYAPAPGGAPKDLNMQISVPFNLRVLMNAPWTPVVKSIIRTDTQREFTVTEVLVHPLYIQQERSFFVNYVVCADGRSALEYAVENPSLLEYNHDIDFLVPVSGGVPTHVIKQFWKEGDSIKSIIFMGAIIAITFMDTTVCTLQKLDGSNKLYGVYSTEEGPCCLSNEVSLEGSDDEDVE